MRYIENPADGSITVEWLIRGVQQAVTFDRRDIALNTLEGCIRRANIPSEAITDERVPVYRRDVRIGTVPSWWHPMLSRSRSIMYDMRPGDFTPRVDGNGWNMAHGLGPGDMDAIEGFRRDGDTPQALNERREAMRAHEMAILTGKVK